MGHEAEGTAEMYNPSYSSLLSFLPPFAPPKSTPIPPPAVPMPVRFHPWASASVPTIKNRRNPHGVARDGPLPPAVIR